MEEESKKKKKKEKSFIEEFLFAMMQSVLRTALNNLFTNLFEQLGITDNSQEWIDEWLADDSVTSYMDEVSDEIYTAFIQEYPDFFI